MSMIFILILIPFTFVIMAPLLLPLFFAVIDDEKYNFNSSLSYSVWIASFIAVLSTVTVFFMQRFWAVKVLDVVSPLQSDFLMRLVFLFLPWVFVFCWGNTEILIAIINRSLSRIKLFFIFPTIIVCFLLTDTVVKPVIYKPYAEFYMKMSANSSGVLGAQFNKWKNDDVVKQILARHPNTPGDILIALGREPSELVQKNVAANGSSPANILMNMAQAAAIPVKLALLDNPQVPRAVLQELLRDQDIQVRHKAEEREKNIALNYITIMRPQGKLIIKQNIDYSYNSAPLSSGEYFLKHEILLPVVGFCVIYVEVLFCLFIVYRRKLSVSLNPGFIALIGAWTCALSTVGYYLLTDLDSLAYWLLGPFGLHAVIWFCVFWFIKSISFLVFAFLYDKSKIKKAMVQLILVAVAGTIILSFLGTDFKNNRLAASIDSIPDVTATNQLRNKKLLLATNHNASPELLRELFNSTPDINQYLASNRNLPDEVFSQLYVEATEGIKRALIYNPNTPCDIIEKLTKEKTDLHWDAKKRFDCKYKYERGCGR